MAEANLDLTTGILSNLHLTLITPKDLEGKQVRKNSSDLHVAEQLADPMMSAARKAKVIFVEVPVGSQSARAMASYGICVGVLGAVRALGIPIIEVTALETKLALTGKKTATKREMITKAVELYPDANWPWHAGKVPDKAEHMADATGSIYAGVRTPMFKNLMRLLEGV